MEYNFSSVEEAQRVLGFDGTFPGEIFSLTFFVPLCSLLIWLIAGVTHLSNRSVQFLELCVLNVTLLLALTLLEEKLQLVLIGLGILVSILFYVFVVKYFFKKSKYVLKDISLPEKNVNRDFIGGYRGHLLLATAISILAVDFNFFPSRFAKTETYGWSMMDAGVGSFILLHGLCSSHGKNFVAKHSLRKCFLSSFPLFLLGFIRLAATTAVGYHKVVPEYGMICYSVLCKVRLPSGLLAALTVLIHQLFLSKAGLADLVISDSRENFFEANKEGICSLLGFVTLYFCGVQLGHIVWQQGHKISDYIWLLVKLIVIGAFAWTLMYPFHEAVQPVSRRMANLPYCIWVVALTSLQLAVHLCQEIIMTILSKVLKNNCEFLLWKAINYNGLFYFLLANLLTGLVNISMNTDESSNLKSFIILILYLTILTVSSVVNLKFSIQLKFW
ncbi:GPI-anchored wall transfer protein 1 [Trichonephila inaurata madagascariensis]|uniref:Phosphatidylinositol-glycan biosynthesis class W protein n=1 Tax=Trichonephila inaurata madagascariensis TaxID=2747483 RepID=A0A8X7CNR9_9ARAC|nr:GPI-anchored wall transfer protein 1 [Trichonephila inaurata madagascariensis]